jgi:hypothetical protein
MDSVAIQAFRGRRPKGGEARRLTVGCSLTKAEKDRVLLALAAGGFPHPGEAVRSILFAYTHSTQVRDAVAAALRELPASA